MCRDRDTRKFSPRNEAYSQVECCSIHIKRLVVFSIDVAFPPSFEQHNAPCCFYSCSGSLPPLRIPCKSYRTRGQITHCEQAHFARWFQSIGGIGGRHFSRAFDQGPQGRPFSPGRTGSAHGQHYVALHEYSLARFFPKEQQLGRWTAIRYAMPHSREPFVSVRFQSAKTSRNVLVPQPSLDPVLRRAPRSDGRL